MTEATVPTQEPRPTRREIFENKQAEHARRFALREKVAAIIKREIAPLAIDAREQQSPVHISGLRSERASRHPPDARRVRRS